MSHSTQDPNGTDEAAGPDHSDGAGTASGEPPGPDTSGAPTPKPDVDVGRRRFFRAFAGEIIQTAAAAVGTVQALQRTSAEAASVILNPESAAGRIAETGAVGPQPGAPAGFRTPFRLDGDRLVLIDQRRLPDELVEVELGTASEVAWAIREMIVRGAPAIGQVAAIGLALTAHRLRGSMPFARRATMRGAANALREARPTAINLGWAVDRMMARYEAVGDLNDDGDLIADALRAEADSIVFEATEDHGRLAELGLALLAQPDGRPLTILTHCNTGPLACGQFGTALGVVQAAVHADREVRVFVDETRPYLQGARLTAWELAQAGVAHTVIADAAAGWLLARGGIDAVLVGADRIAANGDVANKIGTYPLAVLAARHMVPLYVCAPVSSIDLSTADGGSIPLEEREPSELLVLRGVSIAPPDTHALNPAFDVTPAELITAIVTEEGVVRSPFGPGLEEVVAARARRHPPSWAVPGTAGREAEGEAGGEGGGAPRTYAAGTEAEETTSARVGG